MDRARRALAVTLFATALVATVFCMDQSAAASPARGSTDPAAQPWVARLTGNLRRSVRLARMVVERQPLMVTATEAGAPRPVTPPTTARRIWAPFQFSLPPPVA